MDREDEYRIKKGEEGEEQVNSILNQVMEQQDYDYRIIRNAFLPFESVYGLRGYITAEFDFTIFTPFYVFIVEVKNEVYSECNYSAPLWTLVDGTEVSNPLAQNNTHKLVFCSEFNIPREKVITIEILLQNDDCKCNSPYINDYVFGKKDLSLNLTYLLSSEVEEKLNWRDICANFEDRLKKHSITKNDHLENLKRTEKIETRMRRVLKYIPFKRTDIVRCHCCQSGKLLFREPEYHSNPASKRNSKHYALGCTNYRSKSIKCECGLIYADEGKDKRPIKSILPISIESRNGWEEERVNKTVFDEIQSLKEQNESLKNQVSELDSKFVSARHLYYDKAEQCKELIEEITEVNNDLENANQELKQYIKICGRLYYRTR